MKTGTGIGAGSILPGGGESKLKVVKEAAENDSQVTEDLAKKAKEDFSDDEIEREDELCRSPEKRIDLSQVEISSPSKKSKQVKPLISAEEASKIIEK